MVPGREIAKAGMVEVREEIDLSKDYPLTKSVDDQFDYAPFAQKIADGICALKNPDGFVISINGEWGVGKTTVLSFIEEYIEEINAHSTDIDKITVIHFNPWWFSGREDLIRQFFNEFGVQVSQNLKIAGKLITAFGKEISRIGQVQGLYTDLMEIIQDSYDPDRKGIHQLRKEIIKTLKNEPRILLVIDDVDRLNPVEICELFAAIKSIANFPNVIYLVAFDKEIVEQFLRPLSGTKSGITYVEKIVQVSFDIPPPRPEHLRYRLEQLFNRFEEFKDQRFIDFDSWNSLWDTSLYKILKTPRHINRLINSFVFMYPAISNEVNPYDFLLMEIIRLHEPFVYDFIVQNKRNFLSYPFFDERETEKFGGNLTSLLSQTKNQDPINSITYYLFPHSAPFKEAINYRKTGRERRIHDPRYFSTYIGYPIPLSLISEEEFKTIIVIFPDTESAVAKFQEIIHNPLWNSQKINSLLDKILEIVLEDGTWSNHISLLHTLLAIGDSLFFRGDHTHEIVWDNQYSSYFFIIRCILRKISETIRDEEFINGVHMSTSLYSSMVCCTQLENPSNNRIYDGEEKSKELLIQAETLEAIKKHIVIKCNERSQGKEFIDMIPLGFLIKIWYDWSENKDVCVHWVSQVVQSDYGLIKIFNAFVSSEIWYGNSKMYVSYKTNLAFLSLFFDNDDIKTMISRYQNLSGSSLFDPVKDTIFLDLYNKAIANEQKISPSRTFILSGESNNQTIKEDPTMNWILEETITEAENPKL